MSNNHWLKNKRVLITGAHGFIGAALARRVAEQQPALLVGLGRSSSGTADSLPIRFDIVDLIDRSGTFAWAKNNSSQYDVIFHVAGRIDQSVRPDVYKEQFALHADATINLMDALLSMGDWARFVHIGSNAEYGDAPCPQSASTQELPNSAYGCSKLAATKIVLARGKSEKLDTVVARPFLVYGLKQNPKSFLGAAVSAAKQGKSFPTTFGEQTRDFISIDKVVDDLIFSSDPTNVPSGTLFNICTGVERTVKSVLEQMQRFFSDFAPEYGSVPYRETELMRSVGVALRPSSEAEAIAALQDYIERYRDQDGV